MAALLQGVRGEAPVDKGALSESICRFAQLAVHLADLGGIEVNPLVAGADGVIAVDARASLGAPGDEENPRAMGIRQSVAKDVRSRRPAAAGAQRERTARAAARGGSRSRTR
jgi:succinyl-CoA synthetase beta subunit